MEKTIQIQLNEQKERILSQISEISDAEAAGISSDYYAATRRLKMVFEAIVKNA